MTPPMWRLPGYAEVLEAIEPGLRRRQAQQGAPAGFADAISWMLPMTSDQSAADTPSHWSVTFTVDDTDAIAARTEQLGGTIIVAPFNPARQDRDPERSVRRALLGEHVHPDDLLGRQRVGARRDAAITL
jgi:hypothetical protein